MLQKSLQACVVPPISRSEQRSTAILLDLPAEIRNRVYKYALTSPTGIKHRWQKGKTSRIPKPCMFVIGEQGPDMAISINQLQYVNRQLRQETAGLEIQFNRVTFASQPKSARKTTATQNFYGFVGRCTPAKRQWLKHVFIVREYDLSVHPQDRTWATWAYDNTEELVTLLKFCVANPNIRVDFQMPYLTLEPTTQSKAGKLENVRALMVIGVALMWLLRGVHLGHLVEQATDVLESQMGGIFGGAALASFKTLGPQAANLRFFPKTADLDTCLAGRRRDCCKIAREWAAMGI